MTSKPEDKIARIISSILLPPFTLFASYLILAYSPKPVPPHSTLLTLISFCMLVLFPIIVFIYLFKKKKISDQDTLIRSERNLPFLIGILLTLAGLLSHLFVSFENTLLFGFWVSATAGSIAVYVVNRFWKISAHLLFFSIAVADIAILINSNYFYLFLLLPMLWWSRVKLKSHDALQLGVGMAVGFIISLISSYIKSV